MSYKGFLGTALVVLVVIAIVWRVQTLRTALIGA